MDMLREKIDEIVRQGVAEAGVELYHWEFSRAGPRARLLVYIDSPQGVTVDDCARTSHALESRLDSAGIIPSSYVLEVSSPGIERRLWVPWHYQRMVGKRIRVLFRAEPEGTKSYEGKLLGMEGETICLEVLFGRVSIPLSQIIRAQAIYEPEGQ